MGEDNRRFSVGGVKDIIFSNAETGYEIFRSKFDSAYKPVKYSFKIYDEFDIYNKDKENKIAQDYYFDFEKKYIVNDGDKKEYNRVETKHYNNRTTFNFKNNDNVVYSYGVGTIDEEKTIANGIMKNDVIVFHNNKYIRMCVCK